MTHDTAPANHSGSGAANDPGESKAFRCSLTDVSKIIRDPLLWRALHACAEFAVLKGEDPDDWPDLPTVQRFAAAYEIPPGVLGSFFGLLLVATPDGKTMWLDIARGNPPSPSSNGPMWLVELDAEVGFAFFVGLRRAFGRPVPRLPLNGYTAEHKRPYLRLVGT